MPESAYEPPLRLGGTPVESRAQQVLTADAGAGVGVDLGASVFFNRVGGTLTGGVDIDWFTGELESLGYTQFILGGHSTLFPVTHRVRIRPSGGESSNRPCVGGDVHVAVMAEIRVRLQSGRTVPLQVVDLVDPGENPWTPEVPEVAAALDGQTPDLPGTRWKTFVGVKLRVR